MSVNLKLQQILRHPEHSEGPRRLPVEDILLNSDKVLRCAQDDRCIILEYSLYFLNEKSGLIEQLFLFSGFPVSQDAGDVFPNNIKFQVYGIAHF